MTTYTPAQRERMCGSKRKYRTEHGAHGVVAAMILDGRTKGDLEIHVYRCPLGNHWHVGHEKWKLP